MVAAIVYRVIPGKPRQYVRRIAAQQMLWTCNRKLAERMSANDAATVACILRQRSQARVRPYRAFVPTEPAGEYGTEDVTT